MAFESLIIMRKLVVVILILISFSCNKQSIVDSIEKEWFVNHIDSERYNKHEIDKKIIEDCIVDFRNKEGEEFRIYDTNAYSFKKEGEIYILLQFDNENGISDFGLVYVIRKSDNKILGYFYQTLV